MKILKKKMVCVDLETLSNTYDSVIVSIGAVKFSVAEGITDKFSINIDPVSAKVLGMKISKDTVDWWMAQPKAARDAWKINPQPIKSAMAKFNKWWGNERQYFVCNGMSFDAPILNHSYKQCSLEPPWEFRDEIDLRTMYNLLGTSNGEMRRILNLLDGYHCALDDAEAQAKCMIHLLRTIEE